MSKEKPKSALAALLDNVSAHKPTEISEMDTQAEVEVLERPQEFSIEENKIPAYTTPTVVNNLSDDKLYLLDPNLMQPWKFADRPEDEMGDMEDFISAIEAHGQQVPILVRPVQNQAYKYEVIFGNRRWRACKKLGKKILAIVKSISDKDASLYQKEENDQRRDLSELAQARSYQTQIQAGLYKDEKELSEHLGISPQKLNDILAFVRIPVELTNVIPNLKDISRKTAVKLAQLAKNKRHIDYLIKLAPKIGMKQITSTNIEQELNKLMSPAIRATTETPIILTSTNSGKKLCEVRFASNGSLSIKIDKQITSKYDQKKISTLLTEFLLTLE